MNKILITGCAGFIGFHASQKFLKMKYDVVGIDNINDYYDIDLKINRLKILRANKNFIFKKIDITKPESLKRLFSNHKFKYVIHLAAQAGVRYSLENPDEYIKSNILGFYNIIEILKSIKIENFVYASSSSVYGLNKKLPFMVSDRTDHPASLYASTKKSNEIIAHSYSSIYKIPSTGLRFFTVYGPWGRPDMALYKFTKDIINGNKINIYNNGKHTRDFTYIDDIIEGLYLATLRFKLTKKSKQKNLYKIYNLSNGKPVKLMSFIQEIEKNLGINSKKNFLPIQIGDVEKTHGDISEIKKDLGFDPKISYRVGIKYFISWYLKYNND